MKLGYGKLKYFGKICDNLNNKKQTSNSLSYIENYVFSNIVCGPALIALIDLEGNLYLYSDKEKLWKVKMIVNVKSLFFSFYDLYCISDNQFLYKLSLNRESNFSLNNYLIDCYKITSGIKKISNLEIPFDNNYVFFNIDMSLELFDNLLREKEKSIFLLDNQELFESDEQKNSLSDNQFDISSLDNPYKKKGRIMFDKKYSFDIVKSSNCKKSSLHKTKFKNQVILEEMNVRKVKIPNIDKSDKTLRIPNLYSLDDKKEPKLNNSNSFIGNVITLNEFLNPLKYQDLPNENNNQFSISFENDELKKTNYFKDKKETIGFEEGKNIINPKEKAKIDQKFYENKIKTITIGRNKKLLSNSIKNKNLELLKEIEKKIEMKKLNVEYSKSQKLVFSQLETDIKSKTIKKSSKNMEDVEFDRNQDNFIKQSISETFEDNKDHEERSLVNFDITNLTKISNSNNYSSLNHSSNFDNNLYKSNNNHISYRKFDNEICNFKDLLNDDIKLKKNKSEGFLKIKKDYSLNNSLENDEKYKELFLEDDAINQDDNFLDLNVYKRYSINTPAFSQANLKYHFINNENKDSLLNKSRNEDKEKLMNEISQTLKNCKEELGGELVPTYKHLVEENKEKLKDKPNLFDDGIEIIESKIQVVKKNISNPFKSDTPNRLKINDNISQCTNYYNENTNISENEHGSLGSTIKSNKLNPIMESSEFNNNNLPSNIIKLIPIDGSNSPKEKNRTKNIFKRSNSKFVNDKDTNFLIKDKKFESGINSQIIIQNKEAWIKETKNTNNSLNTINSNELEQSKMLQLEEQFNSKIEFNKITNYHQTNELIKVQSGKLEINCEEDKLSEDNGVKMANICITDRLFENPNKNKQNNNFNEKEIISNYNIYKTSQLNKSNISLDNNLNKLDTLNIYNEDDKNQIFSSNNSNKYESKYKQSAILNYNKNYKEINKNKQTFNEQLSNSINLEEEYLNNNINTNKFEKICNDLRKYSIENQENSKSKNDNTNSNSDNIHNDLENNKRFDSSIKNDYIKNSDNDLKDSNSNIEIPDQKLFHNEFARDQIIENLQNFKLTNVKEKLETIYNRYTNLSVFSPKNKNFLNGINETFKDKNSFEPVELNTSMKDSSIISQSIQNSLQDSKDSEIIQKFKKQEEIPNYFNRDEKIRLNIKVEEEDCNINNSYLNNSNNQLNKSKSTNTKSSNVIYKNNCKTLSPKCFKKNLCKNNLKNKIAELQNNSNKNDFIKENRKIEKDIMDKIKLNRLKNSIDDQLKNSHIDSRPSISSIHSKISIKASISPNHSNISNECEISKNGSSISNKNSIINQMVLKARNDKVSKNNFDRSLNKNTLESPIRKKF